MNVKRLLGLLMMMTAACATDPTEDLDGGPGPGPGPGSGSGTGSDAGAATLDPADCDAFAQNAVDAQAACGAAPASGAEAALATACRKGLDRAALCGGDPAAGLACFRSADPSDWVCQLGEVVPSCNTDIEAALGMYCLVKLGDPQCASIACESSLDCPSGWSCNDATLQCFSQSANCVGLPCESSLDCPSGQACNQAEHACIAQ